MEEIGIQVKLPLKRAFKIAVKGIRIRLGRSVVTISGVVLGIAFLMSNLTGQLIKDAVKNERAQRQTVNLMMSLVTAEAGSVEGKHLSIAVFGNLSETHRLFVDRVLADNPAGITGAGIDVEGVKPVTGGSLADGASLLFVMGDAVTVSSTLSDLTAGMETRVVLDTMAERTFAGGPDPSSRRELFFGEKAEEQKAELRRKAEQDRFRVLWIVVVSLFVTVFTVANALLMSVTERFREIGTMKCLGALSRFIRTLFLIESSLIGMAGSVIGVIAGALFTMVIYGFTYKFGVVFLSIHYGWLLLAGLATIVCGTTMSIVAAIYPARVASRMMPAAALRSTV